MSVFVEDLQLSAKLRTLAPISQSTFTDDDLIRIADEELRTKLVADIMSVREDFFLTTSTTAITSDVDHYPVPSRAIGGTLKALFFVTDAGLKRKLERIDAERLDEYQGEGSSEPSKFYIEGDEVVLVPAPRSSVGSLLFSYFAKPNSLIATESCAKITGISSAGGTTTFTVNTDLTADLSAGDLIDFLSSRSPFLLWAHEVEIAAISSTEIQVATADVANAAGVVEPLENDYICPAGYANIPMVPVEFHAVLAQMVGVRLLAGLGDLNKWQAAKAELSELRKEALGVVKNRVESSPAKLVSRNGLVRSVRGY